jgi:hypothetical protein
MIDTLAYAEALIEAGIAEGHAKAHAKAMRDHVIPDLATRQDIADLRSEVQVLRTDLGSEVQGLRTDLRSEVQGLRALVEQRFAETHQRIWQAALAVVLGAAALVGLGLRFLQ